MLGRNYALISSHPLILASHYLHVLNASFGADLGPAWLLIVLRVSQGYLHEGFFFLGVLGRTYGVLRLPHLGVESG